MSGRQSFSKSEKLKSKKQISLLFTNGEVAKAYPLRAHFIQSDRFQDSNIKIGFSVSKKNFKRAVDRNKVKRLMRESYRKQSYILKEHINSDISLTIMFIYGKNEILSYTRIYAKMSKLLTQIASKM